MECFGEWFPKHLKAGPSRKLRDAPHRPAVPLLHVFAELVPGDQIGTDLGVDVHWAEGPAVAESLFGPPIVFKLGKVFRLVG